MWGEGFYLVLPFLLSLPDPGSTLVFSHFYVRKPGVLQPRRQVVTADPGSGVMTVDPQSGPISSLRSPLRGKSSVEMVDIYRFWQPLDLSR